MTYGDWFSSWSEPAHTPVGRLSFKYGPVAVAIVGDPQVERPVVAAVGQMESSASTG